MCSSTSVYVIAITRLLSSSTLSIHLRARRGGRTLVLSPHERQKGAVPLLDVGHVRALEVISAIMLEASLYLLHGLWAKALSHSSMSATSELSGPPAARRLLAAVHSSAVSPPPPAAAGGGQPASSSSTRPAASMGSFGMPPLVVMVGRTTAGVRCSIIGSQPDPARRNLVEVLNFLKAAVPI